MRTGRCQVAGPSSIRRCILLWLIIIGATTAREEFHGAARAQGESAPPAQTSLSSTDRDRLLEERNRLWLESQELGRNEQYEAAIRSAQAMIDLQRKHFDARGQEICSALEWIGAWQ